MTSDHIVSAVALGRIVSTDVTVGLITFAYKSTIFFELAVIKEGTC